MSQQSGGEGMRPWLLVRSRRHRCTQIRHTSKRGALTEPLGGPLRNPCRRLPPHVSLRGRALCHGCFVNSAAVAQNTPPPLLCGSWLGHSRPIVTGGQPSELVEDRGPVARAVLLARVRLVSCAVVGPLPILLQSQTEGNREGNRLDDKRRLLA